MMVQQLQADYKAGRPVAGDSSQCNWILDQLCPKGSPPPFKGIPPCGSVPLVFAPANLAAKLRRGDEFTAATPQQIYDEAERMKSD